MQAAIAQAWEVSDTGTKRWYVSLFPSLTDFAFLLPLFLLFIKPPGVTVLFSDGDTGWHIRTGDWILQHGMVPTTDLFSFTKPHETWFAWEWGWDVAFAAIHKVSGLAGVAFFNAVLLGVISVLLFRLVRRSCGNDVIAFIFTFLATCGSTLHWLARPHLFSWLFVLIFLHVIASAENGNVKVLYWLPVLMLLWTNIHGGFFLGIVLLLTSATGEAIQGALHARNPFPAAYKRSRPYLISAFACVCVTFINPYGWHLHRHVLSYLRDSKLLDNIQEFQSISFHTPIAIFFECMLLLGLPAAMWCMRKGKLTAALSIILWAHLSLFSARNVPLFVFIAAPWAACMALDFCKNFEIVPWLRSVGRTLSEIVSEFQPIERIERWHLLSAAAVILAAVSLASGSPGFEAQFNPKNFPSERAIQVLQAARFSHLFTADQWADYLIYRFPGQKVFMDGRTDFYGHDFVTEYQHMMSARFDWASKAKQFAIDGIMVKPNAAIAAVLKESPDWEVLFDNGSAIIFRLRHLSPNTKTYERRSL